MTIVSKQSKVLLSFVLPVANYTPVTAENSSSNISM